MSTRRLRQSDASPSRNHLQRALAAVLACALVACSSGGGMGSSGSGASPSGGSAAPSCSNCGTAVVSLTDAPGDFLSYIVNLVSLDLTRSDGTVVQAVPSTTQIDLAQLVNLSEIISAAQVPAGRYVSVELTIDFSGATVVVDNGSGTGVTIPQSNLINGVTSQPLAPPNSTQMTLTLSLSDSNQLVVNSRTVSNLALDFNLAGSNTVSPSPTNPTTVTVNPVVTASLAPDSTRQVRVRGPLLSVSASNSSYVVNVLPFYLPLTAISNNSAGQFTVNTTSTTTYAINGTSYTGSAGLTALAAVSAGTLTVAYGSWNQSTEAFTATQVLAGSSVGGNSGLSSVEATVLARSGTTLTLANNLILRPNLGGVAFAPQITATIGSGTTVTEQGQSGPFTIADISVGQQLLLSGTLSGSTGSSLALDATGGSAQLQPTGLLGTVTATGSNVVTVNLLSLGGYSPASLNFAGTGTSSAQDATASAYTVAVPAALLPPASSVGLPMRFSGFVAPFGSAPPDFNATTSVSYASASAQLDVRWSAPGVADPFATLTSSELLIDQTELQAASEHQIDLPSVPPLDPSTLSSGLQLVPDTSASASASTQGFAIVHWSAWSIDTFSSFNDLVTALSTDLNGTTTVLRVIATGPYDASTGVLSADHLVVVLDN